MSKRKPMGYWTIDRCIKEAEKYSSLKEFRSKSPTAHSKLSKSGNFQEYTKHIKRKKMPNNYWTFERCNKEAQKYVTKMEFEINAPAAYSRVLKSKWSGEICKHMKSKNKVHGHWTKKNIHKAALNYKTKKEFMTNELGAYSAAHSKGIIEEVCSHMQLLGSSHLRGLYAFEFPNKSVYVGLTYNYDRRYRDHMKNNKTLIKLTNEMGHEFIMFNELYEKNLAAKEEGILIKKYFNKGWKILNKAKAGSLGGNIIIWDEASIRNKALEYSTRIDFKKNFPSAYSAALKYGILDTVCKHMKRQLRVKNYWDKEKCTKEAKKFKTRTEFCRNSPVAYRTAKKNGWFDEICCHMKLGKRISNWTFEKCKREALKYKIKSDFNKYSSGAYDSARKSGWLDKICKHMS